MRTVDVAIIGGSLAGSACARELAHRGIDAIALERDLFPREKVCGGFLSSGAVQILEDLNVLPNLRSAGAVEIHAARIRLPGMEAALSFRRPGLGVSRHTLDMVLADHPAVQHQAVVGLRRTTSEFLVRLDGAE